jgi:hypothetical protein
MRQSSRRIRRLVAGLLLLVLLVPLVPLVPFAHASGGPGGSPSSGRDSGERLARLRSIYLAAVQDESEIATGLRTVEEIRAATKSPHTHATLSAYEGALITLRAKHAFWPGAKLRHLREGLAILDSVIVANPAHAEARYLRLMSCYYLPGLLGRGWSVREDFAALGRLLPDVGSEYPPDLIAAVTHFVLKHGDLPSAQRRTLETLLSVVDD